jgi:hypothetical protein
MKCRVDPLAYPQPQGVLLREFFIEAAHKGAIGATGSYGALLLLRGLSTRTCEQYSMSQFRLLQRWNKQWY